MGEMEGTLSALIHAALPAENADDALRALEAESVTRPRLVAKYEEGRPALLSYLKAAGVHRLGDRQKITNQIARVARDELEAATAPAPSAGAESAEGKTAVATAMAAYSACREQGLAKPAAWLAAATKLKQRGNDAFKSGDSEHAVKLYSGAVEAANEATRLAEADAGTKVEGGTLLVSLYANLAAAYLRLERWGDVVASAGRALTLDPKHAKALYRRGVALLAQGERAAAKADLVASVRLDPKSRDARDVLADIEAAAAAEREAEKAKFQRGFAKQVAIDETASTYTDEPEDGIREAWREECDRLRTEMGRCVMEVGDQPWERALMDDDEPSQPRLKTENGGYQVAPIDYNDFRRQRKEQQRARAAGEPVKPITIDEKPLPPEPPPLREPSPPPPGPDDFEFDSLDELYAALRAEGVGHSDTAKLDAALRAKGVYPDDPEELEQLRRGLEESYAAAAC